MNIVSLEPLRSLYAAPRERSVKKDLLQLDAHCTRFLALSPFVAVASSCMLGSPGGMLDASPHGGIQVLSRCRARVPC